MTWHVIIPGQPVSGNHANKIGRGYRKRNGISVSYPKLIKTPEAEAYQEAAAMVIGAAKPSGWTPPEGFLAVEYRLYLTDPVDATNVIKTVEDALAPKIGVNDRYMMPRCMHIEHGVPNAEARVEVTIL